MANQTPPPGSGDSGEGKPPEFEAISISDEMRRSYLDYAMSVIVARALPITRPSCIVFRWSVRSKNCLVTCDCLMLGLWHGSLVGTVTPAGTT